MGPYDEASELAHWGGLRLPCSEDGLYRFGPPHTFSARRAVTLGGAMDGNLPDRRKLIGKLHVNWGHASAQQSSRLSVNLDGANPHSANSVGEVLEQRDVCRSFDTAAHVPITGAPTIPMLNEKLQIELLFTCK